MEIAQPPELISKLLILCLQAPLGAFDLLTLIQEGTAFEWQQARVEQRRELKGESLKSLLMTTIVQPTLLMKELLLGLEVRSLWNLQVLDQQLNLCVV